MKPKIAVTLGDPAGVGPELVARICHDEEVRNEVELVVVGRRMLLAAGALSAGLHEPQVELVDAGQGAEIKPGHPSPAGGRQAGAFITKALELCQSGAVQAMTTAPISKEALQAAGFPDTGHTTLLARLTGVERPVMMLAGDKLKVILTTIHVPLRQVPDLISTDRIVQVATTAMRDLEFFLEGSQLRLGVAGLNPHSGEGGIMGREEEKIIAPAVKQLQDLGIKAQGPFPPDTVFWRAVQGEFDVVLAMYHDQGLIPLKLLHFDQAVNVTLGLPIIRTSPDHGTAYNIAGKGLANPGSMKAAVLLAGRMARRKARIQATAS